MIKLRDIGELSFIKKVEDLIGKPSKKNVLVSIGDDCAVVKVRGGSILLISSDMSVENVHFLSECFPPTAIGWKAMASAWSDIASMGGEPQWAVVSIALPGDVSVQRAETIFRGMVESTKYVGGTIVGGDTTSSCDDCIVIDITVIGGAIQRRFITRSGAKPGDIVAVTGTLGNSSAGLLALKQNLPLPELWRSHWYPIPRIEEGRWFCSKGCVSAMIDISDGLVIDAGHIAEMSKIGINLYREKIPVSEELKKFCDTYNFDITNFILGGGEEYQLIVTIPKNKWERVREKFNQKFKCLITEIGYITDEWQGVRVDGVKPAIVGYEHFANS